MPRSGTYRHRVRIESLTLVPTPDGDPEEQWKAIPLGTAVPCSIVALSGAEQRIGLQQQGIATSEVRMRFREDVDDKMRLVHGNRVLHISRPPFDPTGRRRELVLWVKEGPKLEAS